MNDATADDVGSAAERLHEHLAATAQRPVERRARRLLGEAEAVAGNMRSCEDAVGVERASVLTDRLAEVEATGDGVSSVPPRPPPHRPDPGRRSPAEPRRVPPVRRS